MKKTVRSFWLVLTSTLLFASLSFGQVFNWEWQNSKPTGTSWNDAVVLPNGNYVLVGDKGHLGLSTDNGATWTINRLDEANGYRAIYEADFVNDQIGYLAGVDGLLMKTTDGGATWNALTSGTVNDLWYVAAVDADTVYACGGNATLLKTTDAGATWNAIALGTTSGTLYNLFILSPQKIFLGTSSSTIGRLAVSNNYGATFTPVASYTSTSLVRSIYFLDETRGFIGNSSYQLFTTTDGGATFSSVDFGTGTLYEIKFFDGVNGLAAGGNGQLFRTIDGGTTWDTVYVGVNTNLYGMALKGNLTSDAFNDILLAGEGGSIYKSIDFGEHILPLSQTITVETLRDIDFPSETVGYAAGGSTTASDILKTTDGGATWVKLPFDAGYRFYSQHWINENTGWLARRGPDGVFKSTDGGATFTQLNVGIGGSTSIWYDIKFADDNVGYVLGSSGYYLKTTDGGATWTDLPDGHGSSAIYSLHVLNANTVFSAGSSGKLYKTTDGGTTFVNIGWSTTTTWYSIFFVDANLGYLAGASGNAYKTTDGGTTWTQMVTGVTTTLYKVYFHSADIGWMSGTSGTILYTTDGGTTWTVSTKSPATTTLYDITIKNNNLWIAGDVGNILAGYSDPQIPVELTSFSASVNEGAVNISWSTATETNNRGFEIERRYQNASWDKIAFVQGAGTTAETRNYSYIDNPSETKVYYRLKQIDFDGSFEYSNEIEVDLNVPVEFALEQNYPNPFNPATTINYSIAKTGMVSIKIYNTLGEEVARLVNSVQQAGKYSVQFDASRLTSGVYLYQINAGDFTSVKKMMLIK